MNRLLKVSIPILLILGLVLISGCAGSATPSIPGKGGEEEETYLAILVHVP